MFIQSICGSLYDLRSARALLDGMVAQLHEPDEHATLNYVRDIIDFIIQEAENGYPTILRAEAGPTEVRVGTK